MPKTMRLKVAQEYLSALVKKHEPKLAMLLIREKYGVSRRSVYNYLDELRTI